MHTTVHVEIPTTDFKKAKNFFGKIFGWTFQDIPDMEYVLFQAPTPPHGGFFRVKSMPKKGQVNIYLDVEDIDAKLKEIRKARGKVIKKKTAIGTMGWFAQFSTPDGCILFLYQNAPQAEQPPAS